MTFASHTSPTLSSEHLHRAFLQSMHDHWLLFLIEGLVLIALGFVAVVVPSIASLAITILVGWLFLVGGAVGLAATLFGHRLPGFWWSLISAALAVAVGTLLIWSPLSGVLTLTLLLSAFFAADGIASIMFALDHRRHFSKSWRWPLASGIVDLFLAALIVWGFPSTAAWAIGLIVGIDLLFGGSSLVMVALRARTTES